MGEVSRTLTNGHHFGDRVGTCQQAGDLVELLVGLEQRSGSRFRVVGEGDRYAVGYLGPDVAGDRQGAWVRLGR